MTGFDHPERAPRLLGAVTVALTAAAGSLDAVTFFAFSEVFASTMTGNLVMLGLDIGRGRWFGALEATFAIAGYVAGLVLGTLLAGLMMRRLPWRNAVGSALTAELAILILVGLGWYGLAETSWRAVLLVVGAALAMGVQAAALRYVGPSGTPTNFLTGTVTNWVSGMVELHRPRWDGNSALRILTVAVAAGAGAVVQLRAPAFTYVIPVLMVAVAIALMARVTRLNHGGLTQGEAQFRKEARDQQAREVVPDAATRPLVSTPAAGAAGDAPRVLRGRVVDLYGSGRDAVLTLVDADGEQVAREETDVEGDYRLGAPGAGAFTLVCSPRPDGFREARPRASVIDLGEGTVVHDVVLDAETVEAAEAVEAVEAPAASGQPG